MKESERLFLVDGSGYIFRAYYAIRPLTTSKGFPTNALYGFTSMLLKLIRDEKPDHIAVVFDVARKTFRTERFPEYKANRLEPPNDLVPQFPYFRKIVKAMNIPSLELPNYEADDVIGTIAAKMKRRKLETVIVTGDKDMMQLVSDKVTLLDTMKDKRTGIEEVKERFGVEPERVIDILGLAGDSSDNVPGVPGIGEKTAIKLVGEFGSLEGVLKNADKIKGKMGEKVAANKGQALMSKDLVTIRTDCPIEYDFKDFVLTEPDREKLREVFEELEFNRFLSELTPLKTLSAKKYFPVTDKKDFDKLIRDLKGSGGFAVDLETTDLDPMRAEIVGISFSPAGGEAYYVPVGHRYLGCPEQLKLEDVIKGIKPILEDPEIPKYGQNIKYDYVILKRNGIVIEPLTADSMVASYLLNPAGSHNLDSMAQEHLRHKTTTYKEVAGTGKNQKNFSEVDLNTASDYSCEDADVTRRLIDIFLPRLKSENLLGIFEEIEMPLVRVLSEMEMRGVLLDVDFLAELSKEYAKNLKELEKRIYKLAGDEFNINSPKQLSHILFDKLNLPVVRKTKTGYSTDVDVLTELARGHEIPKHLLDYRSLAKLKSTYVDALPALVNPATGRVHTSYNQAVAATGRLSSSDPNLQNIPIRTEEGRKIRRAFIAPEGWKLVSIDYSQIELRVLAHMSGDAELIKAFENKKDIHRMTAAGIFKISEDKVTDYHRSVGKTVNFGIVYGQTAYGLSNELSIAPADAQAYIDQYYEKYAGVKVYKEKVLEEVHKTKKVETAFGRRRFFPDIDSKNMNVRGLAERMAFNTIFQGTAADIIKKAMIEIQRKIGAKKLESKMIMQVHDELIFEAPAKEEKELISLATKEMEGAAKLRVSLRVDVGVGANWAEAH